VAYVNLYRAGMNRKREEIPGFSGFDGAGSVRLDYDARRTTLTGWSKGGKARCCGFLGRPTRAREGSGESGLGSAQPNNEREEGAGQLGRASRPPAAHVRGKVFLFSYMNLFSKPF
jgi:hypothetical protein